MAVSSVESENKLVHQMIKSMDAVLVSVVYFIKK